MFEIVQLRKIDTFTMMSPPPLPSLDYRARLRGALRTYRAKKGRRWTWIYKNEMRQCFSEAESKYFAGHYLWDHDAVRQHLWRWCNEGGTSSDARLVLLVERFVSKFWHSVHDDAAPNPFITDGQALAAYFSIPSGGRTAHKMATAIKKQKLKKGEGLTPGIYRITAEATGPWDFHHAHLCVFDIGEPLFYKANIFRYGDRHGSKHFDFKLVGYVIRHSTRPLIICKNSATNESYIRTSVERLGKGDYPISLLPQLTNEVSDYKYEIDFRDIVHHLTPIDSGSDILETAEKVKLDLL